MSLLGPDGKEMPKQTPEARRMPTRQEKFNMIYMMVTLMTSEERRMLKKSLRPLIRELDIKYPNGMSEGDMKNDIEKAANAVVPDTSNDAKPEDTEIPAEQCVAVQPKGNDGAGESAPGGEGQ